MPLFKSSPYSLKETLKWPWYYFFPSTSRPVFFDSLPAQYVYYPNFLSLPTIQISFIGDIMSLPKEVVPDIPSSMSEIFEQSDLVVGNLEAPLVRQNRDMGHNAFVFSFSEDFLNDFLKKTKISAEKLVLSVANNHIADQGQIGLDQTIQRLNRFKIKALGTTQDLLEPTLIDYKGLRLGIWAYSQWLNCRELEKGRGIMRREDFFNLDFFQLKRFHHLDMAIAFPHWGYEFRHFPDHDLQTDASWMAKHGIDLIAGHHPHVIMPLTRIDDCFCYYSLGNFFARTLHWATKLVTIWSVRVVTEGKNKGKLAEYKVHPFFLIESKNEGLKFIPYELMANKVQKRFKLIF